MGALMVRFLPGHLMVKGRIRRLMLSRIQAGVCQRAGRESQPQSFDAGQEASCTVTVRALGKPVRLRDKDHRKFVSSAAMPCVRPSAIGCAPPDLYTTRALGHRVERRVHRPSLPDPSP